MQTLKWGIVWLKLMSVMAVVAVGTAYGAVQNGVCDSEDPPNGCITSNGWVIEAVRTYDAGIDETTFTYFRTNVGGNGINHIDLEWERCSAGNEFSILATTGGAPFLGVREFDTIESFGLGTADDIVTWAGFQDLNGSVSVTLAGNISGKAGALLGNTGIFNPASTYPRTTAGNALLVPACLFGGELENSNQQAILAGSKTVELADGTLVCLNEDGTGGCSEVVDCTTGALSPSVPESEVIKVEGDPVASISTLGEICPEYFVDNEGPNTRWYCSGGRCYPIPD